MTLITKPPSSIAPPAAKTPTLLRTATFHLHLLVMILALGSLLTAHFESWLDLRALHLLAIPFKILWAASALLTPLLAGPWPAGRLFQPRWIHHGLSPRWARRLLWPTYLLLACLLVNTLFYYHLRRAGLAEPMIPLPLVAFIMLAAWTLLTREWLRRLPFLPIAAPAGRLLHLRTAAFTTPILLFTLAGFAVHLYNRPPVGITDLAVVLGGRMKPDGTASNELAARVQTAIDLYQHGKVKHILLSGAMHPPGAPGLPDLNELAAMRQVCLDAGIPEHAFSLDPVGINTKATAYNTREFMRQHNYLTVVACSSDYHLLRTRMAFANYGMDPYTLPATSAPWQCDDPKQTVRELIALIMYTTNPDYRQPKADIMQLKSPRLVVHKSAGKLDLFDGPAVVKTYSCITGGEPGDKEKEGDRKTPIGSFHIVYKNPQSKFHLSLGLDYPNREDAERGLRTGLIQREDYDGILAALQSDLSKVENQQKLWYTKLGGEIFLHGHANGRPGTAGCVALDNADIEELYAILPVGTAVEIQP